jgi:hypothetical protein
MQFVVDGRRCAAERAGNRARPPLRPAKEHAAHAPLELLAQFSQGQRSCGLAADSPEAGGHREEVTLRCQLLRQTAAAVAAYRYVHGKP